MSTWTSPGTGAVTTVIRRRCTTEVVRICAAETVDELYLSDLRHLVERSAHIPGTAVVSLDCDSIEITYIEQDEPDEDIEGGGLR